MNDAVSKGIANKSILPQDNDLEHVTNINGALGKAIINYTKDLNHNGEIDTIGNIDNTEDSYSDHTDSVLLINLITQELSLIHI